MIPEITLSLPNRPGELHKVLDILHNIDTNIQAFCVERAEDYADLRLILEDEEVATEEFEKRGYDIEITKIFALRLDHTPGALLKIASLLGDNGINVEYGYLTLVPRTNMAIVLISVKPQDIEKAASIMVENDIKDLDRIPIVRGR